MIYRRIYEQHFGPIPQGYHIHHIDGDRTNNNPSNLIALSPKEHYNVHFEQGDWAACLLLSKHSLSADKSQLASLSNKRRIERGDHPFGKKLAQRLLSEGRNPFQNSEIQRRNAVKGGKSRSKAKLDHLQRVYDEVHSKYVTCPHCGKTGQSLVMHRWHFDKCKHRLPLLP
jgi:hypothetical protein